MSESTEPSASTRIDPPHEAAGEDTPEAPSPRRRARRAPVAAAAVASETEEHVETPRFVLQPADAVPEIVVNHAYDLSLHLAERLREVERRELAAVEHETKLQEAEAAARVWVCQRDLELSAWEREL
jgi:hypothetical protein